MPAIVVTGVREPARIDQLAADVIVIQRATLEASTADSVADLLRREAGVQLSRNGGPGQSTGLLLRGAASVNTVVLVDGVRIGSATLGFAQLDALSLASIERIEVLRGPGSSLYGADAVGGVVHIITRRGAQGIQHSGHLAAGGYGSREASFGLRGAQAGWDYALTVGHERSDGVSAIRPGDAFGNHNPDADGHKLDSLQAQIGLSPATGHRVGLTLMRSRLHAQFDSSEYLPPTFAPDSTPDFRNRLATDVAALDWRGAVAPGMVARARLSRSVDDLKTGGSQIDRFRTTRTFANAQLAWKAGAIGELVGAVESLDEAATASSFVAEVERRNHALVLALAGADGPWAWQADVRRDDSSDFGGVTTARLGGSFTLAPGLRLRALAGSTFRAPSFNDLYYPGYGVASLQPERGRSVEVGLRWTARAHEASATLYRNRVRQLIGYESDPSFCPADPSYSFGCARNLNRAQLQGATLSGRHQFGMLGLTAQFDWVDAKDRSTGQPLNRRARQQGTLGAEWQAGAWTLGASVLHLGARPDGGSRLAAETTLDLAATWRLAPNWRVQAKLVNATDEDLQPVLDYQGLGRQAWLVVRYGM